MVNRLLAVPCVLFAAASAHAQVDLTPRALVVNDTPLGDRSSVDPADPLAPLITPNDFGNTSLRTNAAGGWAVQVRGTRDGFATPGNYYAYYGTPAAGVAPRVLRTQGQTGGFTQTQLSTFFTLTDAGGLVYNAVTAEAGSVLYRDDAASLPSGSIVPGFPGRQFDGAAFVVNADDAGNVAFYRNVRDVATTTNQREFFRRTTDGSLDRLLYVGQPASEIGYDVGVGTGNFAVTPRIASDTSGGDWVGNVTLAAAAGQNSAWVRNGQAMTIAGRPVRTGTTLGEAAGGPAGETWNTFSFSKFTLNDSGDLLFHGRTSAPTGGREVLALNDTYLLREGQAISGVIDGTLSGFPSAVALNDDGDWAAVWSVRATGSGVGSDSLIVNGEVVVTTSGDTRVDLDGASFPGTVNQDRLSVLSGELTLAPRRNDGLLDVYFTGRTNGSNAIQFADTILFTVVVPEPAAGVLAGVAGLVALRRRR